MPCLNTVLQPNDRKSSFNKSTLANPVVSSYCCSPVTFFITPWAVSLFISGPPLALLQGITAGNYRSRMLIASSTLPEFHSHLIESGSETNTGHAGYVYLQLHHFYKNAPVRETSCQPTANWSLPYALRCQVGPKRAPFLLTYAHGYFRTHIRTPHPLSPHTSGNKRTLWAPFALCILLLQMKAV